MSENSRHTTEEGPRLADSEQFLNQHGASSKSANTPTAVDVVKRMYDSFRARDYDAFERLCAPDIEWIQNEGFPGGGFRVGPRAVFDHVFTANGERWAGFGFEIEQYLDAGDTVVVIGHYVGTNNKTASPFRAAAAHVYEVREGLIARYRQFADTHILSLNSGSNT
jgi:ketosteroid isomerase-like protein